MTTHAYIADLSRERREVTHRTGVSLSTSAVVAVCGAHGSGSELRCFGLRRLAEVWERMGQHVDCSGCRTEVRRLLADHKSPAQSERLAALERWVAQHPLRGSDDTLKAEAQRRRMETRRRREREARAANPLCACGRPKVKDKAICGAEACALRRAIEVRRGIR